jgi:two-component system CheB/CheR fusion protein
MTVRKGNGSDAAAGSESKADTAGSESKPDAGTKPGPARPLPPLNLPSYVVGIGASAGGLEALERLFQSMPSDTGMAFVVVQHLSPDFKSLMNELLARWTDMPVHVVEDRMPVAANQIFLMPPQKEMIISDGKLLLTAREPSDELRLPIDQFFRSLARDAGEHSIAVVLSGTGSDGSRGIRDVHEAGGHVIVQSDETAKFNGMPKSAIETGVVDAILAPGEIPSELLLKINHPSPTGAPEESSSVLTPVFRLLREKFGIDFTYYKPSTVGRRLERRVQLSRAHTLEDYVEQLFADGEELDALYRDLLIGVTSFFRDPGAFQVLQNEVIPQQLKNLSEGDEFRVWAAGCATGEEAYSLAILVDEQIRQTGKQISAKIFATDVHARSLELAATGLYHEDSLAAVTAERLHKYFSRTADGFRVSPELRNMVVFAPHNIIRDAPFTRLNLISCRNLLIYLVPGAQQKALSLFHFGLKTGGALLLGPSESPGELSDEFESIDPHWKLFRKRRDVRLPADLRLPLSAGPARSVSPLGIPVNRRTESPLAEVFEHLLDEKLPPSVLVDERLEIAHTFGDASQFLRLRKGIPSLGLLDMLSDPLRMAVGAAIHRARHERRPIKFSSVQTGTEGSSSEAVDISVTPVAGTRRSGIHTLICFETAKLPDSLTAHEPSSLAEATRDHVESLEAELRFTKENLQATVEELETSNEELQATNEELLASNEELQSTNEELHSVNEELYTVNAEYQDKIQEQAELTQDMNNLLKSTDVHTIFLDGELCIRKFTPKMGEVFNLIESDIGRRIHGFVHTLRSDDLPAKLLRVLESGIPHEEEVQNNQSDYFFMRILPYHGDQPRSGVVMTLIDMTALKAVETQFSNAIEVSPNGLLMVDSEGRITLANSKTQKMFGYSSEELIGQPLELLMAERERDSHLRFRKEYFHQPYVIQRMGPSSIVWGQRKDGTRLPLDVRVNPITTPSGIQAIASLVDMSDHQSLQESLQTQVQQRDHFLATLSHELRNPMAAILTAASLLREVSNDSPEVQKPCAVIRRQASQIATLLDDLLDVSRVTQGKIKMRVKPIDLVDVCRESLEAVEPLVAKHQHHVILDLPDDSMWIEADRVRIVQTVENLLTNAIKYTPDGGNIELQLSSEGNLATLQVRDDGCGMSRDLQKSVFDMFVQSDQTLDRSEGGMGVGLTLVRTLVELHQGTIDAFSEGPNQGSEFVVRLPLTTKRPEPEETSQPPLTPEDLRLVLVEDNDDTREMLTELLSRSGYNVVATAEDGLKGCDMIIQHQPDAALLDVGLPKLDGFQIARRVREQLGSDIKLVALTGYGRDEDHEAVLEAGFNEHLVKPINLGQLAAVLLGGTSPARQTRGAPD